VIRITAKLSLNLPESHIDVWPLGTALEDAVQFQRRVLEDVDERIRTTLSGGKVTVSRMCLEHKRLQSSQGRING